MQDQEQQGPPDSNQKSEPARPKRDGGVAAKRGIRKRIIWGALAVVFGCFAGFLVSFDLELSLHALIPLWLFFICTGIALIIELRDYQGKRVLAYQFGFSVIVVGSIVCAVLLGWKLGRNARRPHLTLYATLSNSPNDVLFFTNGFLFLRPFETPEHAQIQTNVAFLVVPVLPGQTNVVLKFGVLNDSAPQYARVDDSAFTADLVHLEMLMLKSEPSGSVRWTADSMWRKREAFGGHLLYFALPHSLLPGQGNPAPPLAFEMPGSFSEPMAVAATIRGKRVPNTRLLFRLLLVRSTEPLKLSFHTNSIAVIHIR